MIFFLYSGIWIYILIFERIFFHLRDKKNAIQEKTNFPTIPTNLRVREKTLIINICHAFFCVSHCLNMEVGDGIIIPRISLDFFCG